MCLLTISCTSSSEQPPSTATTTTTSPPTNTDSPADGGLVLLDPGSEPRHLLTISEDADVIFEVTATEESVVVVDGATTSDSSSAEYQVVVQLRGSGDTFLARAEPTITAINTPAGVPDELGTWVWTLTPLGSSLSMGAIDFPPLNPDVRELLTFPHLFLEVPVEPVGIGARWAKPLDSRGEAQLIVEVDDITDTEIVVTMELTVALQDGEMTTTTTGIYDRNSLLALETVTETTLTAEVEASNNGNPTIVAGTQESTRALSRVQP